MKNLIIILKKLKNLNYPIVIFSIVTLQLKNSIVPIAKHLSNGGQVFAFEPQSQNYKLLLDNINDNNKK